MKRQLAPLALVAALGLASWPAAAAVHADFDKAWNLIATCTGADNALEQAQAIAIELKRRFPSSGYSEVLQAQELATWESPRGNPSADRRHSNSSTRR